MEDCKMKVELNKHFFNIKNERIVEGENSKSYLTLRRVISDALLHSSNDQKLSFKDKLERYKIYKQIKGASKEVNLATSDAKICLDCVSEVWGILIVGQVAEYLGEISDGKNSEG